jgi:hypothetical protein
MIPQVPKNARIRHSRFSGSSKKSAHDFRDLKKKRSRFFGSPISRFWVSGYPSGGGSLLSGVSGIRAISRKKGVEGGGISTPPLSPPPTSRYEIGEPPGGRISRVPRDEGPQAKRLEGTERQHQRDSRRESQSPCLKPVLG